MAALAAVSAASAQSTVTLYGVVDASYGGFTNTTAAGVASKSTGISSQQSVSRIGFRGTEDLGGGLKANFTLEYYIEPDNGSGIGAGTATTVASSARQAFVGVSGNFGSVDIGNQSTLIALTNGTSDFHGGTNTVGYSIVTNQNSRRTNMIQYVSPNFQGFTVSTQMGFAGAVATNAGNNRAFRLVYANGPVVAAIATEVTTLTKLSISDFGAIHFADFANGTRTTDLSDALATRKRNAYGTTYDFGVAKVGITRSTASAGSAADAGSFATTSVGVQVPMGAIKLNATLDSGSFVNTGVYAKTSAYQLSATYDLSKRTNLYTTIGEQKNKTTTAKDNQYSVGVRHSF